MSVAILRNQSSSSLCLKIRCSEWFLGKFSYSCKHLRQIFRLHYSLLICKSVFQTCYQKIGNHLASRVPQRNLQYLLRFVCCICFGLKAAALLLNLNTSSFLIEDWPLKKLYCFHSNPFILNVKNCMLFAIRKKSTFHGVKPLD